MLKRFIGGLSVVLGLSGIADAQYHRPAYVRPTQAQQPSTIQPVKQDVPVAMPGPISQAAPQMAPAIQAQSSNLDPRSYYAREVAEAAGDYNYNGGYNRMMGYGMPADRFWVSTEWLYWTTRGNKYPPLVTTAPVGTPQNVAGTIGDPRTSILLGGEDDPLNDNWRSGFRLRAGLRLGDRWGVEGDFFFLGDSDESYTYASDGSRIIMRPFTNNAVVNGLGNFTSTGFFPDTQLVSFPNVVRGSITVDSSSQFLGAGVNLRRSLGGDPCDPCNSCNPCGSGRKFDLLLGYRYLRLEDTLNINEDLVGLAGSQFPGVRFQVNDYFRTLNQFHGVNLGFDWERSMGGLFFGVRSTVALGVNHTTVDINGSTAITDNTGTTREAGGLLAQPSNIGRYTEDDFSVVPEVGLRMGLQVTDHLRVFAGYNFIYWSNVIRPGDVIDSRVNASQIPPRDVVVGTRYPFYEPRRSGFWAHGVSVGLELRY